MHGSYQRAKRLAVTPHKTTNMSMETQPFEDVSHIKHGDFPVCHVCFFREVHQPSPLFCSAQVTVPMCIKRFTLTLSSVPQFFVPKKKTPENQLPIHFWPFIGVIHLPTIDFQGIFVNFQG